MKKITISISISISMQHTTREQEGPVLGVLALSSNVILGFNKKKVPRKKFTALHENIVFSVASKKTKQNSDYYCVIQPDKWVSHEKYPFGNIVHLIGPVGYYDSELECLKIKHNIKWKPWKKFNVNINDYLLDLTPSRENLSHLNTISIDPKGCEDIDDCIHYRKLQNGSVEIGIHISDVSSYIPVNSIMDREIQKRGQSVYLTCGRLDMLPEDLAIHHCSLREGVSRRAFSVIFTMDIDTDTNNNHYNITGTRFCKSTIINKKALSYEEAETTDSFNIHDLYDIGKLMYNSTKKQRTFLEPYDIHKMVEMFMVKTNSVVAKHLYTHHPKQTILRTHRVLSKITNDSPHTDNSEDLSKVVKLMNAMKLENAEYTITPDNTFHEGLNEEFYTHFTSPIRRYLDIVIHRQLYSQLQSQSSSSNHTIENTNVVSTDLCNQLNTSCRNIKKAERESEILNIVYNLYDKGSIMDTYGYITFIDDSTISIYISEFKTILKCSPFHHKIIDGIHYKSTNDTFTLFHKHNKDIFVTFKPLDKVKIQIAIEMNTPNLKKKIIMKILDNTLINIMNDY